MIIDCDRNHFDEKYSFKFGRWIQAEQLDYPAGPWRAIAKCLTNPTIAMYMNTCIMAKMQSIDKYY